MNDLIAEIIHAAEFIPLEGEADSIEIDKRLGELEALVYKARQMISDEWRSNRIQAGVVTGRITNIDLEELGL